MTLVEQVTKDMTSAMKNQDKFKLSVLRMLKSALQMEKISKMHDLSDDEAMAVIKRQVKQRNDSIEEFKKYNKTEEVEKLEKEVECLQEYLPEMLTDDELSKIIDGVFNEVRPESIKDMGKVMKEVSAKVGARADMSKVSSLVKEKLTK